MVISYLGGQCFKISRGDLTLCYKPPAKDSTLAQAKFGADIALSSLDHKDFNGVENAGFGERQPFVINGAGEYEVRGVGVRGFGTSTTYDKQQKINTIYSVNLEGLTLCFLGALRVPELPAAAKEEIDDIDILFVPVGGGDVLDKAASYKLAVQLEPKVVVPMHYDPESLKQFLKEAGAEASRPVDKLTVKKKDLEGKEVEVVGLQS